MRSTWLSLETREERGEPGRALQRIRGGAEEEGQAKETAEEMAGKKEESHEFFRVTEAKRDLRSRRGTGSLY